MQSHHVIRALRPGSDEVLCVEAERITGSPAARELVARHGTVEAVSITRLLADECRVLEREYRKRGGTVLASPDGSEVLLMGPLLGLGELPEALRSWGPATERLGSELEKVLHARARVLLPWTCAEEQLGLGEDVMTLVHVPSERMEHGKPFSMTVEQKRGKDEGIPGSFTAEAVFLDGSLQLSEEEVVQKIPDGSAILLHSTARTQLPVRLEQFLARADEMDQHHGIRERMIGIVWEDSEDPEQELSRLGEFLGLGRPCGIQVHGTAEEAGDTALLGVLRGAAFVVVSDDSRSWSEWLQSHSSLIERWNHLV